MKGNGMDDHRFDSLTKAFATRKSRRGFIAGVVAGFSRFSLPMHRYSTNCRPVGRNCKTPQQCCTEICAIDSGSKAGSCAECLADSDCAQSTNPCQKTVCIKGICTVDVIDDGA